MTQMRFRQHLALLTMLAGVLMVMGTPARADTIIDEWATVKAPAPPELKPVTADGKTALLLLDFGKQNCGVRPRCVASLPKVQKMAAEARAKKVLVVHSLFGQATKADLLIAPLDNEAIVTSGANKFLRTELEKILRDRRNHHSDRHRHCRAWRRSQYGCCRRAAGLQSGSAGRCDVGRPVRGAVYGLASGERAGRDRAERDRHADRHGHVLTLPELSAGMVNCR